MTKQVVAQNLLFEHNLMNSDLLRFVTPEKLRKEVTEPELPYPLLRWMTREQQMKLLPSILPDSDGGYNEADVAELTNEEIKELRLEWK